MRFIKHYRPKFLHLKEMFENTKGTNRSVSQRTGDAMVKRRAMQWSKERDTTNYKNFFSFQISTAYAKNGNKIRLRSRSPLVTKKTKVAGLTG